MASLSTSGADEALPESADPAGQTLSQPGGGGRSFREKRSMWLGIAVILGALALFVMGWAALRAPGAPRPMVKVPDAVVTPDPRKKRISERSACSPPATCD